MADAIEKSTEQGIIIKCSKDTVSLHERNELIKLLTNIAQRISKEQSHDVKHTR